METDYTNIHTLNLDEAAEFLNMSSSALREKVKAGVIPGAKIGKRWVFIESDLVAVIRSMYALPRQALQVTTLEKSICHYSNATTSGGFTSPHPVEKEYANLLELPIK